MFSNKIIKNLNEFLSKRKCRIFNNFNWEFISEKKWDYFEFI